MLHTAPTNRATDPASVFRFDMEVDVMEKSRVDGSEGRFIGGYVSTSHMDRQGETLIQEGLDFGHFLSKGWYNDNHDPNGDSLVGYPTVARLDDLGDGHKGWYVEGKLLPPGSNKRADDLWNIAQGLQKAGGERKLGYSVEGTILDRDPANPKVVRKAQVREVAITRCPVNTKTSLDVLAKSLAMTTPAGQPGSADAIKVESLEGAEPGPNDPRKKKRKKRLKKSEAVSLLMRLNHKVDRRLAEKIVDYAVRHYPAADHGAEHA